jgi:glycosyltransferase involved in cell wall biosynthesis
MHPGVRVPGLSVVVPVYDEEESLPELQRRLEAALETVEGGYEVVFVDDGSRDRSPEIIEEWIAGGAPAILVRLSRNFGMDVAMSAGLDYALGERVVLMHADLQDPPELIPEMLTAADAGADVVYARRIGRDESVVKRVLATAFYATMQRLARTPYQGQAGDFRLMSRRVVDTIRGMPERPRFLRGMVAWVGFEQVPVEYRRVGRRTGAGASYPQLFRLALDAVASFSDVPLAISAYFGLAVALVSGLGALVLLLLTLIGAVTASAAVWALAAVLFLGGVQLICIGILGRYLARVHEQELRRPLYVVSSVSGRPGEVDVGAAPPRGDDAQGAAGSRGQADDGAPAPGQQAHDVP